MEMEERIGKIERVVVRIALLGGVIMGAFAIFTLAAFEYGKMIKYLWLSW